MILQCWRARLEKSGLIPEMDNQRIFGNVDELIVLSGVRALSSSPHTNVPA